MAHQMLVRMQRNWDSHAWVIGMADGTSTLENSFLVSSKVRHCVYPMTQPCCSQEWDLPEKYQRFVYRCSTWLYCMGVVSSQKQPKCLSVAKRQTYCVLSIQRNVTDNKNNERWIDTIITLKIIMLSKRYYTEMEHILYLTSVGRLNSQVGMYWEGPRRGGLQTYEAAFAADGYMFIISIVVVVLSVYTYVKIYEIVHLEQTVYHVSYDAIIV